MLDPDQTDTSTTSPGAVPEGVGTADTPPVVTRSTRKAPAKKAAAKKAPAKKAAAKKAPVKKAAAEATAEPAPEAAVEPVVEPAAEAAAVDAAAKPVVKKTTRKAAARKTPAKSAAPAADEAPAAPAPEATAPTEAEPAASGVAVLFQAPVAKTTTTRRTRKKPAAVPAADVDQSVEAAEVESDAAPESATAQAEPTDDRPARKTRSRSRTSSAKKAAAVPVDAEAEDDAEDEDDETVATTDDDGSEDDGSEDQNDATDGEGGARRRRRRGGRRRRKSGDGAGGDDSAEGGRDDASDESASDSADAGDPSGSTRASDDQDDAGEATSRRRRRRRRSGDEGPADSDDAPNTVTRVRRTRSAEDQITAVAGSTRLEAKKQRRREGREAGRRRAPIVSEAEFLARRESVDRVMVIRQRKELTQIAVLEDKVLVEHYVARESQTSLIGNVYLGRVQNVLPSMEAAFIDIGKGRNAVLYAGEVNWSALGHKEGQARKIESVLSSGQMILVQVTKDPIGHKGARLTSQVSLAGRFLVYVPDGTTSGISRKLPDTERNRLKTLLKEMVPDTAGVIVRTAAEGASEEELIRDVERLTSRWADIEKKSGNKGSGPQLLYGEPDLTLKVVRDLFTEDFAKLVIEGDDAWGTVRDYVEAVAPDLTERVEKFERPDNGRDVFATYRIDEQIHKGLDRKVWLPSGGSLVIDRTEAMTVVDVNTGKFTGSGGNLEETVTKNNLEAAEEIVRQLRLRDIGGIIVVDFIDMVLESNRDLVVRRLVECLGRDRTRHQVAEVTSLGLVQMTRKRIGTGLLESFSENCDHCQGRGVVIKEEPVEAGSSDEGDGRRSSRGRRGRRGSDADSSESTPQSAPTPSPKDVAAMARHDKAMTETVDEDSDSEPETGQDVDQGVDAATAQAPATVAAADESAASPAAPADQTTTPRRGRSRS
ncbi:MAG: Rne/Rng family ribonuclease, partial [Nocardioides sp.]|nr:Rne/Rng family ribonuclease [Nocardioides sp.]